MLQRMRVLGFPESSKCFFEHFRRWSLNHNSEIQHIFTGDGSLYYAIQVRPTRRFTHLVHPNVTEVLVSKDPNPIVVSSSSDGVLCCIFTLRDTSPAVAFTVHQSQRYISSSSVHCPPESVIHLYQWWSLSTSLRDTSPTAVSTVHQGCWVQNSCADTTVVFDSEMYFSSA